MVQAWYMQANPSNPREECQLDPPEPVSIQQLKGIGVLVDYLNPESYDDYLEPLAKCRGYTYQDEVTIARHKLPDYARHVDQFFAEHLHADDEIRYVIEGCGYFDVRDANDRWIRIKSEPGDLITLPAGSYHRFSPDLSDFIHVMRLFQGEPVWTAHFRSQPDTVRMEVRHKYRQQFSIAAQ